MALGSPLQLAAGTHAWFAVSGATLSDAGNVIKPSGDASSPTTVGRNAKPSAADTARVKLEHVVMASLANDNGTGIEEWIPVPGGVALNETLRVGRKRTYKLTLSRTQAAPWRTLLNTLALNTASTQFNPGEAPQELYGWLFLKVYDHAHTLRVELDVWVELTHEGELTLDPKARSEPALMAVEHFSVLNTGNFA